MNKNELREKWLEEEKNAKITGWDFSYIDGRYYEADELMQWDYKDLIVKYLSPADILLDMDTGGGEFLLGLGHENKLISVTESYPPNVELCRQRLEPLGIKVYDASADGILPFDDETFDIVINRHGSFNAEEIYRILKRGGHFITQQVGEDNDRELVKILMGDLPKPYPGMNLTVQKKAFEDAGFVILESGENFLPIEFYDTGALIWFAKIIEWEFPGFSVEKYFENVLSAEEIIRNTGKVSGKIHRYMIVAQK
ncbi:MAG: methyltransferase domain-containing protein [Eubacteriaceae bacterium]|nr:methyltransferase domain-containing protein [Eubacteriaceae bacterium]